MSSRQLPPSALDRGGYSLIAPVVALVALRPDLVLLWFVLVGRLLAQGGAAHPGSGEVNDNLSDNLIVHEEAAPRRRTGGAHPGDSVPERINRP